MWATSQNLWLFEVFPNPHPAVYINQVGNATSIAHRSLSSFPRTWSQLIKDLCQSYYPGHECLLPTNWSLKWLPSLPTNWSLPSFPRVWMHIAHCRPIEVGQAYPGCECLLPMPTKWSVPSLPPASNGVNAHAHCPCRPIGVCQGFPGCECSEFAKLTQGALSQVNKIETQDIPGLKARYTYLNNL